jgi:predicted RNA-binding Zn ribbon-like protein
MSVLPAWYPDPGEAKAAPTPLLLVQAFLNTRDLDQQTDVLSEADAARAWLSSAGLLPRGSSLGPVDLELVRAVREGIRSLLEPDRVSPEHDELAPLRELVETHRLRLIVDDLGLFKVTGEPNATLSDGLFGLLLIIHEAQQDGTWERLKPCANPDCAWVFYDRSRNHQGSWCEMAVCGNRVKNRKLRARRR